MDIPHCVDYWKKWRQEGNFCGIGTLSEKMNNIYLDLPPAQSIAIGRLEVVDPRDFENEMRMLQDVRGM